MSTSHRKNHFTNRALRSIAVVAVALLLAPISFVSAQEAKDSKEAKESTLPLFYKKLELLDANKHKALGVAKELTDLSYASQTDFIPIAASELSFASRHYPLVFVAEASDATPTLVAMVGLGENKNLFVDAKGRWRSGVYIPAWVRRYPFITVKTQDNRDAVAFDPDAKIFTSKNSLPLFENDKPTLALERILAFQNEFNAAFEQTQAMAKALQNAGVLEPSTLSIGGNDKDRQRRSVSGFLVVNEEKLRSLDGASLAKLNEANALGLAYAQMLSLVNLQSLTAVSSASAAMATTVAQKSEGLLVQIGVYATIDAANLVKTRLEAGGHKVTIQPIKAADGSQRYQVRIGPFESAQRANEVRDRAKAQGYDATVLDR
ncbi:MAG: hypothetical protein RL397_1858 [Pseudomonadota bacterium]